MKNMIRQAQQSDLASILDIYNDAIINTTAVYTYQPTTIEERQTWFKHKQQNGDPIFVFEKEGIVQGFATYGPLEIGQLIYIPSNTQYMFIQDIETMVLHHNYYQN